jgi:hypothetical protein
MRNLFFRTIKTGADVQPVEFGTCSMLKKSVAVGEVRPVLGTGETARAGLHVEFGN